MGVDLKKISKRMEEHRSQRNDRKPLIVTLEDDGSEDVIFNMGGAKCGAWKGVKTSVMVRDHEGRRLLKWMLDKDFGEEALEIITIQLDEVYL